MGKRLCTHRRLHLLNPSTPSGVFYAHSLCLLKEVSAYGRRVWRKRKSWTKCDDYNLDTKTSAGLQAPAVGHSPQSCTILLVRKLRKLCVSRLNCEEFQKDYCHPYWHFTNSERLNKIYLFKDNFLSVPSILKQKHWF
jgi:hypothetical protein